MGVSQRNLSLPRAELADIVLVNKCDGALADSANRAASDYRSSLKLLGVRKDSEWAPPVLRVSAATGFGLDALLSSIEKHRAHLGDVRARRHTKEWDLLWTICGRTFLNGLKRDPGVLRVLPLLRSKVASGDLTIDEAADEILGLHGPQPKN
jgi:LAO/AO transport system kinase